MSSGYVIKLDESYVRRRGSSILNVSVLRYAQRYTRIDETAKDMRMYDCVLGAKQTRYWPIFQSLFQEGKYSFAVVAEKYLIQNFDCHGWLRPHNMLLSKC